MVCALNPVGSRPRVVVVDYVTKRIEGAISGHTRGDIVTCDVDMSAPERPLVLTGGTDFSVQIYNVNESVATRVTGHARFVWSVNVLPWRPATIAVGVGSHHLEFVDYERGVVVSRTERAKIRAKSHGVWREREIVLTSTQEGRENTLRWYGLNTPKPVMSIPMATASDFPVINYLPEDGVIVCLTRKGTVAVVDMRNPGKFIETPLEVHHRDGSWMWSRVVGIRKGVCASVGKEELLVWELSSGKVLRRAKVFDQCNDISYFPPAPEE